jgi:hypothetical protein
VNPKARIALVVVAGILTVVVPPAILKASGAPFMVVALVACVLGGVVGAVAAKLGMQQTPDA